MAKPYQVALLNAPDLPAPARITAEVRYANMLERTLGGEHQVVKAWLAMTAHVSSPDPAAVPWEQAKKRAHAAAATGLALPSGAYFDVELVPARV